MEYLLKASAVIALFYICYKVFLQKETFFQSNRWFLLLGLVSALLVPFIVIPIYIVKDIEPLSNNFYFENNTIIEETSSFSLLDILPYIYLFGVLVLTIKLIFESISLALILRRSKKEQNHIITNEDVSPFSFFKWIVYNPTQFNNEELQQIITHEKVHVSELHSFDIITMHLASILFWFNPFIWLYKKDMHQNLEFIADNKTQEQIQCSKTYQHLLLKTSVPNYQMKLANNFYNSLIKKRIVMLHKNKSNKKNLWKYTLILPMLVVFLMSFSTKEIITYNEEFPPIETNNDEEIIEMIVTKDSSDEDLEKIKKEFESYGVTVKFKGVKRNSKKEIIAIKVTFDSKKGQSGSSYQKGDEPISPLKISYDSHLEKVSVNSAEKLHFGDHDSNVFIMKKGHDGEHNEEHKVVEHKKIFIKSDGKVHELKEGEDHNVFIIKDEDVHEIEVEEDGLIIIEEDENGNIKKEVIKHEAHDIVFTDDHGKVFTVKSKNGKDGNVIVIQKDKDGNIIKEEIHGEHANVWTEKDGKTKFVVRNIDTGKEEEIIIEKAKTDNYKFVSASGKYPLLVIDGKIVKDKKIEDLESESIESVSVLKGEAAIKKYGKKAEHGVIEITTKK